MERLAALRGLLLPLLLTVGLSFSRQTAGQQAGGPQTEAFEKDANRALKARTFKEAAQKFHEAAEAAPEPGRRARMELQAAWAHFNAGNPKASREALKRALVSDANLEIVPEFFSPEFLKLVDEARSPVKPVAAPARADLPEIKRSAVEKLADNRAEEVIYDLTHYQGTLDPEARSLLARAYDMLGRPQEAMEARRDPAAPRTVIPSSGFVTTKGNDASDILAAGRGSLSRGDFFAAQSAANRAIEVEPNSSEAYRLLGDAYFGRSEKPMAEASWRQSLRLNEKNEAALLTLADFYIAEKNLETGLEMLRKAFELNPTNGAKLLELGRKLRAAGDLTRASQVFATAAAAAPGDASIQTENAVLLLRMNNPDAALDALRRAAAAARDNAVARANLAALLKRKGLLKEAEAEYRDALRAEPEYPPALNGFGMLLLQTRRPTEAVDFYRRAAAQDPKNLDALLGLARALRLAGDLDQAAAALAVATDLEEPEVWNEAGVVDYERGRYSEALEAFEKAAAKDPSFLPAQANRKKARAAAAFIKSTVDADLSPKPPAGR